MIPSFNSLKKLEAEFSKKREDLTLSCPENGQAGPLFLRDSISFDNVCFRYKDHTDNTFQLKNISFTIKARTMTAFAGPSGSGKSTVIDLLLGLLRPLSGEIIIDNSPLDQGLMKRWRNSIGYVPQDPFLLNCSIRENLQRFTPQASEQEIRNALELAWALELVDKLDKGLDEVIGDRGVKLSGGERQRIVLARALLRKPSILILDEATSSLDTVSEHRIQQALEALHGSLTIIMIAHRLSSVKNADNIIVMSDGKIAEQGTYAELSEKKGGFFRLMLNIDNNKGECENGH